jgi:hypothetical protein
MLAGIHVLFERLCVMGAYFNIYELAKLGVAAIFGGSRALRQSGAIYKFAMSQNGSCF